MEKYVIRHDVKVFCTTAVSFPDGIQDAFIQLGRMLPGIERRTFYGISYKNAIGDIIYKAAIAESCKGEADKYTIETFLIRSGTYLTETVNWRKKPGKIEITFNKLLANPDLDVNSPCLEWYINDEEVICMVRLNTFKA